MKLEEARTILDTLIRIGQSSEWNNPTLPNQLEVLRRRFPSPWNSISKDLGSDIVRIPRSIKFAVKTGSSPYRLGALAHDLIAPPPQDGTLSDFDSWGSCPQCLGYHVDRIEWTDPNVHLLLKSFDYEEYTEFNLRKVSSLAQELDNESLYFLCMGILAVRVILGWDFGKYDSFPFVSGRLCPRNRNKGEDIKRAMDRFGDGFYIVSDNPFGPDEDASEEAS